MRLKSQWLGIRLGASQRRFPLVLALYLNQREDRFTLQVKIEEGVKWFLFRLSDGLLRTWIFHVEAGIGTGEFF